MSEQTSEKLSLKNPKMIYEQLLSYDTNTYKLKIKYKMKRLLFGI